MRKKGLIAISRKLAFIAIALLIFVSLVLSAQLSITGNVFVKTIQKSYTAQITTKNISNGTSSATISDSTKLVKTPTTIIAKGIAIGENMLVPLEGVRKTLAVGDTWLNFAFGYDVHALSIDARASPRQVLIAVYKNGTMKDDAVVKEGEFYDYIEDYPSYDNLLIFRINMSRIFAGATSDMVDLKNNYVSSIAVDACNPEWECRTSQCLNYRIERAYCVDSNSCHKSEGKPPAIESCQDNKTLSAGETWYIGDDNYLQAISIDARASPKQALLALTSPYSATGLGESGIAREGELFEIVKKWSYGNITVFSTRIDSIYAAATSDMVRLKDTYLLAANLCSCEQLWECGAWGMCINGRKTRACNDLSNCSSRWSASDLEIGCDVGLPLKILACGPSVSFPRPFSIRNPNLSIALNASQANAAQEESQDVSRNNEITQNQANATEATSPAQSYNPEIIEESMEIVIEKESEGKKIIKIRDSVVETPLNIVEESSKLYLKESEVGKKKQIVFPKNVLSKILEKGTIRKIVLEKEDGKAVYHLYTAKKVKLLLIFSASLDEEVKIDAESGEIIETKTPWWAFLSR